jgi:hypothetical protein
LKGTMKRPFHQSWLQLVQWFLKRRFFKFHPTFVSILSLMDFLIGSRDHRTYLWKGANQGPFHQSLVAIGWVVSEEKIFMWISHRVLC